MLSIGAQESALPVPCEASAPEISLSALLGAVIETSLEPRHRRSQGYHSGKDLRPGTHRAPLFAMLHICSSGGPLSHSVAYHVANSLDSGTYVRIQALCCSTFCNTGKLARLWLMSIMGNSYNKNKLWLTVSAY